VRSFYLKGFITQLPRDFGLIQYSGNSYFMSVLQTGVLRTWFVTCTLCA